MAGCSTCPRSGRGGHRHHHHHGPLFRVAVSTRFGFSGYFTTSPLIMTGAGSVIEADVGALNSTADGFSTYLEP